MMSEVGITTECECGETLRLSPSRRGDTVCCLECGREVLALEPAVQEQLEEERDPFMEAHVRAISFWLMVCGMLLGVLGVRYLISRKLMVVSRYFVDPGPRLGGILLLLGGGGLLGLSYFFRRHYKWARNIFLTLILGLFLLVSYYIYAGTLSVGIPVMILLTGLLLTGTVFAKRRAKRVFRSKYRERMAMFRPVWFCLLKSYFFWGFLILALVIYS